MKTNAEAKQDVIKKKWEEAGFVWSEIENQVDRNGLLFTTKPDNLTELTGYNEAMINCQLKWLGRNAQVYLIELSSIEGIDKNNGWTRIEPDGTNLPDTTQDLMFTKITDGRQEKAWYNQAKKYFAKNYTHFRPVDVLKPPIY